MIRCVIVPLRLHLLAPAKAEAKAEAKDDNAEG